MQQQQTKTASFQRTSTPSITQSLIMSVFVPPSNYNEIAEGRKRSSTRRKASAMLVKIRSEDSGESLTFLL